MTADVTVRQTLHRAAALFTVLALLMFLGLNVQHGLQTSAWFPLDRQPDFLLRTGIAIGKGLLLGIVVGSVFTVIASKLPRR